MGSLLALGWESGSGANFKRKDAPAVIPIFLVNVLEREIARLAKLIYL
jgi:hypothetical protein